MVDGLTVARAQAAETPAEAGIHNSGRDWIPAFAGMTAVLLPS